MEVKLDQRQVCDLQLIMDGSFAPLKGYMTEADYKSVLNNLTLADGSLFPLPICLAIPDEKAAEAKNHQTITLKDPTGFTLATMAVESVWKPDLDEECRLAYGTTDTNHPYVQIVKGYTNKSYIGGTVTQVQKPRHFDFNECRRTPEEVRAIIKEKGWQTVVGFQTRNIMHRCHFELSKLALKLSGDPNAKLLLNPTVGITQDTDTNYSTRVRCYKAILPHYEPGSVLLSLLNLSMRMAGPREAVLHALIRQNYGCTHFIVGRDHAGPSTQTKEGKSFYGPYDAQKLAASVQDKLKIKVMFSCNLCYIKELDNYIPEDQVKEGQTITNLSGTKLRQLLREGKPVPEWFTFKEVQDEIYKDPEYKPLTKKGFAIYCVGLPSSGKTSLTSALRERFEADYPEKACSVIDGDEVRLLFSKGLGFSKEDRMLNIQRIGYLAGLVVQHGGIALVANIAPYEEARKKNRDHIEKFGGYIEVFVNTPLEECIKRDAKGLYKLAQEGKIQNMTGINDPFEAPTNSEITFTGLESNEKQIECILEKLKGLGYVE